MNRILIVDDNDLFRRALVRGLRGVGVSSLNDGLVMAERIQPDIIFLDVRFDGPWKSGIDAIKDFVRVTPKSKIVVMTSFTTEYDRERALQAGAAFYFDKNDQRLISISASNAARRALRLDPAKTPLPR